MVRLFCLFAVIAAQTAAPLAFTQESASDIKSLLTAYEKRDPKLPPDPEALGRIARMVMVKASRSLTFRVWSEECASPFVTDKAACDVRLQKVLDDKTRPVAMRAEAGLVLTKHGDAKAA